MAVPKRRTSKRKKRARRTHYKAAPIALQACPRCGDLKQPHKVCPTCGLLTGTAEPTCPRCGDALPH